MTRNGFMPRAGVFCLLLLTTMLFGCSLPPLPDRPQSQAIPWEQALQTPLGQGLEQMRQQAQADNRQTGYHVLHEAQDAFAARALLARTAQRSLDVQYYIWRDDTTGRLLLNELLMAADRGVRVRLLLDDHGTQGLDEALLTLGTHPQIEVRLFNPFALRKPKLLNFATDFFRLNRRMHNKSFTADNQASILGGRNVGNEYFGATDGVLFFDLDLLVAGAAVPDISNDFDRYWASPSAYPVASLVRTHGAPALDDMRRAGQALLASEAAQNYQQAIEKTTFVQNLLQGNLPMQWARAQLISDDPAKVLGQVDREEKISALLVRATGAPQRTMDIISPYFVPTAEGTEALIQLRRSGVRVRVLTNSVRATDVLIVHSGYAKYRQPLLQAGVELFELRPQTPDYALAEEREKFSLNAMGSSGSSLHSKTFVVDGQQVFVGSFNFDPRSARLNTEMGLLLESPALADTFEVAFSQLIPSTSYRLSLGDDGRIRWHSGMGNPPPVYDNEPETSGLSRLMIRFMGALPIEWLL
jgi:putative cardiolipin synthase